MLLNAKLAEKKIVIYGLTNIFTLVLLIRHGVAVKNQRVVRQADDNEISRCVSFRCSNGVCIDNDQLCNGINDCPDGADESGCRSKQPMCPALVSSDQNINCKYLNKDVPCYDSIPSRTKAEINCNVRNSYFEATSVFYNFCRLNGQWISQTPDCGIECGKISAAAARQGTTLPWTAFIVAEFSTGNYIICSATIISPFAVISNARCSISGITTNQYRVLVGKGYNPSAEQYHEVEFIHLHPRYNTTSINYELSIFETKSKIVFNDFVGPACIDEQNRIKDVVNQAMGSMVTVTGDNMHAAGAEIRVMKQIRHLNYMDCRQRVQNPTVVSTQDLCGLYNRNNGQGDSQMLGAGMTFDLNGVNYLYGVGRMHEQANNADIYVFSDMTFDFNILFLRNRLSDIREKYSRKCKAIFSTTSLSSKCEYEGNSFACDRTSLPGTVARLKCKEGYKFQDTTSTTLHNFCQDNGEWSERVQECVPECGILNTVGNGRSSVVTHPWKANLFDKRNDTAYWVICEGTLVSPYAILTAARCAFGNDAPIVMRSINKLKAVVGHRFLELPHKQDVNAKYVDVENVFLHPQYDRNNLDKSEFNVAIFELRFSVTINRFVLPICFDPSVSLTSFSSTGTVIGWDIDRARNANVTQIVVPITYVDYDSCQRLLPNNVFLSDTMFCGIDMSDQSKKIPLNKLYDRGAGATFEINNRHYLFGVSPHRFFTERNSGREVFSLIDTQHPVTSSFINSSLTNITKRHSIPTNKCQIPFSFGTKYSKNECFNYDSCDEIPAGEYVETFSLVHITCAEGFAHPIDSGIAYTFSTCNRGNWQPRNIACVRLCEPLSSDSVWVECYNGRNKVDCSRGIRPGIVAYSYCSQGYFSNAANDNENTCQTDGSWSKSPMNCRINCGFIQNESGLISGGSLAKKNQHPWNVALYHRERGEFVQVCGGTIIGPMSILTAAHCFHRSDPEKTFPLDELAVGFGKQYRSYMDSRDQSTARYARVAKVNTPELYKGSSNTGFILDIAIIELATPLQFNDNIIPACIDLTGKYNHLLNNSVGTVVGWGLNATSVNNGVSTDSLNVVTLPYISFEKCKQLLDRRADGNLPKDKFCALNEDGSSVQPGDSGAGMLFKFERRHYVVGVVSSQIKGERTKIPINTFTSVVGRTHLTFIKDKLQVLQSKDSVKRDQLPNRAVFRSDFDKK